MQGNPFRAKRDVPVDKAVFGIIDVETTGLAPCDYGFHRIVELACILVDAQGNLVESFSSLVFPERLIPHDAASVHGISDSDVAHAPLFRDAWKRCIKLLSKADILWGFNSPFDLRFIIHELCLADKLVPEIELYDVSRMVVRSGLGRMTLGESAKALGLSCAGTHRAEVDCETTARVLTRLLQTMFPCHCTLGDVITLHDNHGPVYSTSRCLEAIRDQQVKTRKRMAPAICVTGSVPGLPRSQVKQRLAETGFRYVSEANPGIAFAVLGIGSQERKASDCAELGVMTMSADEFKLWLAEMRRLGGRNPSIALAPSFESAAEGEATELETFADDWVKNVNGATLTIRFR